MTNVNKKLFELLINNKIDELKNILINDTENTIDVNIRDDNNNYLLNHTIHMMKYDVIKLLIQKGCRMDIVDDNGRSILYIPIERNLYDMLVLLLSLSKNSIGIPLTDVRDENGNIALHYAIKKKNLKMVNILLDYSNVNIVDKNMNTSLHLSVYSKSYDICRLILNKNTNINARCDTGETALHIACNMQLFDICELLIKHNINVNIHDYNHEYTTLHYAVILNYIKLIKLLLSVNVDQKVQDIYGNTPLHYAITESHPSVINMLLSQKEKINVNLWNVNSKIPLHFALEDEKLSNNTYVDILITLSNLNIQESINGNTCMHLLCINNLWKKHLDILKTKKMDVFIQNKEKKRPIDYVSSNDLNEFIELISNSYLHMLRNPDNKDVKWSDKFDDLCKNKLDYETSKTDIKLEKIKDKNDVCSDIIKNKLMKLFKTSNDALCCSKPSFPIKKNYISLKIDEGKKLYFCSFTGNTMDVLFGLIFLLDKHKSACSTLSENFSENKELCKFYKSIGVVMNSRCEFLNFEIVWVQYKLHIIDNFSKKILNCLKNKRYIIFPVGIELHEGSHANYLLYDKQSNEIERFEPHGGHMPSGLNYNDSLLDSLLETKFKSIIPGIIYVRPKDYLQKIGFQILDMSEGNKKYIGDPGGFCALWSIWYVDMRMTYPDIPRNKFLKKSIETMRQNNISFKNMIRNYAHNIISLRDELLHKSNMDINDWINDDFDDNKYKSFIENISKKINILTN